MLNPQMIADAKAAILENWGDAGKRVIEETTKIQHFNGTTDQFLDHCVACGGNWGGMLLSGIKELYPNVWAAIPDDMGDFAFYPICCTLMLCGVDTSEK